LSVLLSGSLAFDHIMVFPGHFEDHILPDKIHILNVSFLVDSLDRLRGGVAGNIAYNLALLKQPCRIVSTVGTDFDDYRSVLDSIGVDTSGISVIENELTASAFITTDRADNQITGFYPGAMSRSIDVGLNDYLDGIRLGVISPTAPDAMCRHASELKQAGIPYLYDPGQQIVSLSAKMLREGVNGAFIFIGNDYEFAMVSEKTGMSRDDLVRACPVVIITYGELGSRIYNSGEIIEIPSIGARPLVDPTGAGDAYRAGLVTAYLRGLDWSVAGRVAALTATYTVEVKGTQSQSYSIDDFIKRFNREFPEFVGAADILRVPVHAEN
jgi:adenosine kinase